MQTTLWKLYSRLQTLILQDEGQDLIEYALVVALIAFAAVASMQILANDINATFVAIGTSLVAA
jgi:pilus assembly protein Flp/PilA